MMATEYSELLVLVSEETKYLRSHTICIDLTKVGQMFLKKRYISVLNIKMKEIDSEPSSQPSMAIVHFIMPYCTGEHSKFLHLMANRINC
jgi:hypothetical protein